MSPLRLAALCLALLAPSLAQAAAGPWVVSGEKGEFQVRLVSAVEGTGDLAALPLGIQMRFDPGWKTYWPSPGSAGLPPAFDWSGTAGAAGAEIAWPAPHRSTYLGIDTLVYEGEVVLPVTLKRAAPGGPAEIRVTGEVPVCAEICIFHSVSLALDLPAGPATPGPEAVLRNRYLAQVPGDGAASGLRIAAASAEADGTLRVAVTAREPLVAPDLFVEGLPAMYGAPEAAYGPDRLSAVLTLKPAEEAKVEAAGRAVTLTLVDGERSVEAPATLAAAAAPAAGALLPMLAVALLGGLLLNLMPCVLPVLSLKLLGLAQLGGQSRGRIRAALLATAAGILVSFLALAGALAALKAGGAAVGWGIQFQQPLFLVFMVVVLTLFATNLWGLFEVPLPRFAAAAGERLGPERGLAGHFLTGAFATLLATPCSAPFLGTAVGFALAGGTADILMVFAALGLGLALPYLAVAALPGAARLLPRPGRWMAAFKRVLAVALAGTALWLLTVLAAQIGGPAALSVALLMAMVPVSLRLGARLPGRLRRAGAVAVAVLAVAAFAMPASVRPSSAGAARPAAGAGPWKPFSPAAIGQAVGEGKVVVVDVTADWCITCQANKKLVLDRGEVAAALAGPGVVALRADWTRPDPTISAYLAGFGRYGIPFNVVYGPGAPGGLPLSELLTTEAVLDAIKRAGGA